MKTTEPADYKELTARHIALAKELCADEPLAWPKFFKTLTENEGTAGYLPARYEQRLQEKNCSAEIDDFCSFLYSYLQENNHYVLTILIETNQNFFSKYFRNVLKDAYANFEKQYASKFQTTTIDGENDENLHERLAAEQKTVAKRKLSVVGQRCSDLFLNIWKNNQLDYLSIWFGVALNCNYKYVADLLGFGTDNAVAKRVERFREAYCADGTLNSQQLDNYLAHDITLQFAPSNKTMRLILHMPFYCKDKENCFIRMELLNSDSTHLTSAAVKYGKKTYQIKNGWGELKLSEYHELVKIKKCNVCVIEDNGNASEVFPVCTNELPVRVITENSFDKWSTQQSDTLQFIADFGTGFAWLLNRNMDYEWYGAPKNFDYADLSVVPGEALVLFASDCKNSEGVLPSHGFVFPLEWRYLPEYDNPHSNLLPQALIDLGKKIAAQQKVSRGWGLHPSYRFFHDRVDFSRQTVFGATDETVASAYLTLSATLILALQKYTVPSQIFASAQYDWKNGSLQKINLLESKLNLAENWSANSFFVARDQQGEAEKIISANKYSFNAVGCDSGKNAAFHFLEPLRPAKFSPLKTVPDPDYKQHRPKLVEALSALVNASWDKKDENAPKRNSFVILSGNPGMGKSILMSDLCDRYAEGHTVFSFACNAGDKNCAENFVKSIAYQMASSSSAFAVAALNNLSELSADADIEKQYRKLVCEPLLATADKNSSHRYYILVDGLDEDASGTICRLLTDKTMQFPVNYAVVVSTRPVEPLFGNLQANATGVLDLGADEFSVLCRKDLKKFIINYIYSDENVSRCWQDSNYNDDELREKIGSKDKSFLYAQYVLQGVADGMYHFDQLDKELPAGLTAFYDQSFRYRFATDAEYNVVRPLLKLLLENESVSIGEVSACLQLPIGRLVKLLQGYCVVSENTLSLSDATLREWLRDSIKNPDFSIS